MGNLSFWDLDAFVGGGGQNYPKFSPRGFYMAPKPIDQKKSLPLVVFLPAVVFESSFAMAMA